MNNNWNCPFWQLCLRVIWLAVIAAGLIGLLRLMAWADNGARDLEDNTVLPSERAHDINYGKP